MILRSVVLVLLFLSAFWGCGQSASPNQKLSANAALYKLAHSNGCIECHRISATVVGPSWEAISERYKDAPIVEIRELLVERVKKGSRGNWVTWKGGNGMPPLEKRVSQEAITQLVDYIIAIKRPPVGRP